MTPDDKLPEEETVEDNGGGGGGGDSSSSGGGVVSGGTGSGSGGGDSSVGAGDPVPGDSFGEQSTMSISTRGQAGSSQNPIVGDGVIQSPYDAGPGYQATPAGGYYAVEEYFGPDHKWHLRGIPRPVTS